MAKQLTSGSLIVLFLFFLLPSSIFAIPWTNGQNATYVVGQSDFVSSVGGCTTQLLAGPGSVAFDYVNGCMYVADISNNRVLKFNYPLSANNPAAVQVFGQADFSSNNNNRGTGPAANTLWHPSFVMVHNGDLWVSDGLNNRVLRWTDAYTVTTDVGADLVIGQTNFTTITGGCTQNIMNYPCGLAVDASDNLWVADGANNRVLRFPNCNTLTNGDNADLVLGQADYTSNSYGSTAQSFYFDGYGYLAFSNNNLWVSDNLNSRVLRFSAPFSTNQSAVGVIGQPDFSSDSDNRGLPSPAANTLSYPMGIYADQDNNLYVVEAGNYRVSVFVGVNSIAGDAGSASYVLGQTDFSTSSSGTTQNNLYAPYGISGDGVTQRVMIADFDNNRVLQFDSLVSHIPSLSFWASIALIGIILIFGTIKIMKLR